MYVPCICEVGVRDINRFIIWVCIPRGYLSGFWLCCPGFSSKQ